MHENSEMARFASYRQEFLEEGAVHIPQALSTSDMAILREAFEFKLANAGRSMMNFYEGQFLQALGGDEETDVFTRALRDTAIADVAAGLFGEGPVWFMEEQIFFKKGGRRTPWHQDASYQPFAGTKNVVLWVSFDNLASNEALEVIPRSHLGPLYNGVTNSSDDDTSPAFPEHFFPRVPDIEADRSKWPIRSWAYSPGDVLAFHPKVLHGGAPCAPDRPRRSLALRMFGDDVVRIEHPGAMARTEGKSESHYLGKFAALAVDTRISEAMTASVRPWETSHTAKVADRANG